jgi:DNA adenine methylase
MTEIETFERGATGTGRADLRAPFPWFGGKSRVAHLVWDRFGNVPNLVEPFFGSGAVLLARPLSHRPFRTETVNDIDAFVSNWWRAVTAEPDTTATWADYPVNEADMLARHKALIADETFRQRIRSDPYYYDCRIAGWWAWGLNIWIGDGWCRHEATQLPHLGDPGKGINRRLPHLGDPGKGRSEAIRKWFAALAERMRDVRVCCGEWDRVLGESVTTKHGMTGMFLDPPYESSEGTYAVKTQVSGAVREWAIANGDNPLLRIAICSYGEEMPGSWECVHWRARKGYQKVDENGEHSGHNETIWFSPACLRLPTLFNQEDYPE